MRRAVLLLTILSLAAPASNVFLPEASAQVPSVATICSTQWGWCPLDPSWRITPGRPCHCVAPSGQTLAGVTRYFNYAAYQRPVSPYLNPHWADTPPPPPVIR
jgi:hypothetical protein